MRTTTMRNVFVKLAIGAVCLFASVPLFAGFGTVLAKGFKPNIAYQVNEFDAVNTLSGDLMVRVPLGPTYKTNGVLQYNFGVRYSADFWSYVSYYGINQQTPDIHFIRIDDERTDLGWEHIVLDLDGGGRGGPGVDDSNFIGSEAIPTGTAGVGWNVDTERFGAIVNFEYDRGGTYIDASGASHTFRMNMHSVPNCGNSSCNNTTAYTHDGSYLRMRIVDGDLLQREVDLPDGTVKHFHCVAHCADNAAQWNLEWSADQFGNVLLIERTDGNGSPAPTRPAPGQWIWNYIEGTLPDGETRPNPYYTAADRNSLHINRQHRLVYSVEDPNGKFSSRPWMLGVRLVRAELAGPQGDRSMQFIFNYEPKEILRTVIRPYIREPNVLLFPYTSNKGINVQVLKSITMPDNAGLWQFQYKAGSGGDGEGLAYTYCMDFTAPSGGCPANMLYPTSRLAGRIDSVRAPTGGGYAYDYAPRSLPRRSCVPGARNAGGFGGGTLVGIKTRKQLDEDGHEIPGNVWRYSGLGGFRRFIDTDHDGWDDSDVNHNGQWDIGIDTLLCRAPLEFLSSTLDPKGLLTINYYNVHVGDSFSDDLETSGKWFAAPFSPDPDHADTITRLDGTTVKRYLSMQQYEVDMSAGSPFVDDFGDAVRRLFRTYRFDNEAATTATLRRSNYAIYEASAFDCDDETGDCEQYNLRVPSDHVRFDDDTATTPAGNVTEHAYVEHISGDFDGLGHYRQKNIYGNLKAVGRNNATGADWDHHIDYQLFNPNVSWSPGTPNPTGLPFNWITNTYTHTTALEAGRISSTRYFFDATRGFLRATRKMEAFTNTGGMPIPPNSARDNIAATSADDFLTTFTRTAKTDDDGQPVVVQRETDYGGDNGHVGSWDPQNGQLGIDSNTRRDYTVETTYRYGAPARTEYRDCDPNLAFLVKESAFIEPGMGLPTTMTDESGLTTNYAYDSSGRVTQVSPPGGLTPQTYTYESKTGPANINRLTVLRAGGATLTYEYDYLGRLSHESHLMPTGPTSTTTYTYTATGRVATQVLPMGTPGSIRYKYDVFDREKHVDGADNKTVDTVYNSVRGSVRKTNGIAVDIGDPSSEAQLSKSFDTLGRVWQVSDDATRARYEFDALGDIIHVILNPAGSSSPLQHRRFDYDGRGVLVTSEPPELRDASGTGWQTLVRNSYDARGHITATDYIWADPVNHGGSLARWQLRFDYDAGERLQKVWQPASGGQKIFKNFTYYGNNDAPGNRARLKTAVRKNYYPDPSRTGGIPTIDVTTTLAYNACTGLNTTCTGLLKTSSTVASIPGTNGAQAQSFFSGTVGYDYDARGDLARIDYPEFSGSPSRSINYTYAAGFLTSVKEGTARRAALTYYLNGLTNTIQYAANNAIDVITADSSGISRVGKFDWKWTGGSATSDGYSYDGAGNISGIGPDKFFYDRASRLVRATVAGQSETYAYDGFSNLTSNGARTNNIDWPSNRLKPPVVYDEAGNIAQMPDPRPAFAGSNVTFLSDALNAMTYVDGTNLGRAFVYDASDERIGIIDYKASGGRRDLWSIRDENGRVLRDFARTFSASGASQWTWDKDYVYRGNFLSNTISAAGVRDIHVDHLGSTRFVTDANGQLVAGESSSGTKYWPFGNLVFARPLDERLAFTGHERDDDGTTAGQADFDYLHARYYSPSMGRFLSMDVTEGDPSDPQSWNRYTYARNRPLILEDPDGRCPIDAAKESVATLKKLAVGFLRSASHFDDIKEAFSTYSITDPPKEQLLIAGVVILSVADLGANLLEPEEGAAENVVEHTIIEAGARGRASEARVLEDLGMAKNTERVTTAEGTSIPDFKNAQQLGDIKDTQRVTNTRQMRIQREAARRSGADHVVITGTETKVSKPVEREGTQIIRRDDLGPRRPPQ